MGIGSGNRQIDGEPAPFSEFALECNVASVEDGEASGQRQPKPGALLLAVGTRIHLLKLVKDSLDVIFRDADTVVGDDDL